MKSIGFFLYESLYFEFERTFIEPIVGSVLMLPASASARKEDHELDSLEKPVRIPKSVRIESTKSSPLPSIPLSFRSGFLYLPAETELCEPTAHHPSTARCRTNLADRKTHLSRGSTTGDVRFPVRMTRSFSRRL